MNNILVIGSGGREHAIIRKLKKDRPYLNIYCLPGNDGIAMDAKCFPIKAIDIKTQIKFAQEHNIDYVIVTPDDPLALGAVDAFEAAGFKCFGPTKKAAQIEASKAFAKDLMHRFNIPTAAYAYFDKKEDALNYIKDKTYPLVIKADGLALGKGVIIAKNEKEANNAIEEMLTGKFGEAGKTIVIEEYLEGPEISVLSFTDGKTLVPMVSSMDHKRAFDFDEGLNTGGMGAIAPNPFYTKKIAKYCYEHIYIKTIDALNSLDITFKGCLYFSLMLTKDGPKVIEYNARFGDPETEVVLPLLESDLLDIMLSTSNGKLADAEVKFSKKSSCCIVLATKGYPSNYEKGYAISIDEEILPYIDMAGITIKDNHYYSNGGRVLMVNCVADNLKEAIEGAYKRCAKIDFKNGFKRNDIGYKALKELED